MFWTELKVLGMHNIKILADADMQGIILILFYTTLKTKVKQIIYIKIKSIVLNATI